MQDQETQEITYQECRILTITNQKAFAINELLLVWEIVSTRSQSTMALLVLELAACKAVDATGSDHAGTFRRGTSWTARS